MPPPRQRRIAVLTAGGDAPGMNAAIRGVVRVADANGIEVIGAQRGFEGLVDGNFVPLPSPAVANIIQRGGTMLETSRSDRFRGSEGRARAAENLHYRGVEAVVIIGGDGTLAGASGLCGGSPTARDRLLASRMGVTAVKGVVEGRPASLVAERGARSSMCRSPRLPANLASSMPNSSNSSPHSRAEPRVRAAAGGLRPRASAVAPARPFDASGRSADFPAPSGTIRAPRLFNDNKRFWHATGFAPIWKAAAAIASARIERCIGIGGRIGPSAGTTMENAIGPHQILPSQYFGLLGGRRFTAEQRLMLALMADAINVYQRGVLSRTARKRLLYVDAERWIMANGANVPHTFSFESACDALGIDSSVLRRKLVTWKHRVQHEPQALPSRLRLKVTARQGRLSRGRSRMRKSSRAR